MKQEISSRRARSPAPWMLVVAALSLFAATAPAVAEEGPGEDEEVTITGTTELPPEDLAERAACVLLDSVTGDEYYITKDEQGAGLAAEPADRALSVTGEISVDESALFWITVRVYAAAGEAPPEAGEAPPEIEETPGVELPDITGEGIE